MASNDSRSPTDGAPFESGRCRARESQPRERPRTESDGDAHDANAGTESPPPSSRADDDDAADEAMHDTPSPVDITPDERGEPDPRRDVRDD